MFQKRTWSRQGELKTTSQENDTYMEAHEETEDQLREKVGARPEVSGRSHTLVSLTSLPWLFLGLRFRLSLLVESRR